MIEQIQFIGTQRSGTNLLRLMLNQHSEISAHHPPHILQTFIPILPFYGDLTKNINRYQLVFDVCQWVKCNPISWDPIELNEEEITASTKTLIEITNYIYKIKAISDQARIWCCKSTFNAKYFNLLEESGQPLYIYLFRDGRDVALSFKKAIVGPKHIYNIALKWVEEQQEALAIAEFIPKERFIFIRYEELLQNPAPILTQLCEQIGIDFQEQMLNYYNSEESKLTANSGEMWKNVAKPIINDNFKKYQKGLTIQEIHLFETIAGQTLLKLGYEIENQVPLEISSSEIAYFQQLNREQQSEIIKNSNQSDLENRRLQTELLKNIKNRFKIE